MKILLLLAASVSIIFAVLAGGFAARELNMLQFAESSPSRQYGMLLQKTDKLGLSHYADRGILVACKEAMTGNFGRFQPSERRLAVKHRCADVARRIVQVAPTNALAHLVYASAINPMQNADQFNQSYVASQLAGPNEAWIVQARFQLGVQTLDFLEQAATTAHDADTQFLVQTRNGIRLVALAYSQHPEMRSRIEALVEELPEGDQLRFLASVEKVAAQRSGS